MAPRMKKYQLSIRAESLPSSGFFRRSISPYATVSMASGPKAGKKIGKTETMANNSSPEFCKMMFLRASPSVNVQFEVVVYDDRGKGKPNIKLGEATFEASAVYSSPGHSQSAIIHKSGSQIHVNLEECVRGRYIRDTFRLQLRGLDMINVEPGLFGLGRSDPFFVISKKSTDSVVQVRWNAVYRSAPIHDHLNPMWEEFQIGMEQLCYGDLEWPLKIQVFDYNENGKHQLIGETETTITKLQENISIRGNADRERAISLTRDTATRTYGLLVVLKAKMEPDKSTDVL